MDRAEFLRLAGNGAAAGARLERTTLGASRKAADGTRKIPWVLSDGKIDRAGDRIDPNGWDVAAFRANPVVLFAHDSFAPPIARAPGVRSDGTRLRGDVEFADAETYAFADTIFRLVIGGYITAGSVGFMPIEWSMATDRSRPGGIDFNKVELLEFSIVPVPCNANALAEARAKGIDIRPLREWAERALDERRHRIPRRAIENLYAGAGARAFRGKSRSSARLIVARRAAEQYFLKSGFTLSAAELAAAKKIGRERGRP